MDEPGWLLRSVTWHFASGDALFVGWFLLVLATLFQACGAKFSRVALLTGLAWSWIALAAWPAQVVPFVLLILTMAWLWSVRSEPNARTSAAKSRRHVVTFVVLLCAVWELPYQWSPRRIAPSAASVAVIGDSITAGLNAADHTWPRVLAEHTGRTVFDASQQGGTVKSAAEQLRRLDGRGDVLWIEIGGNDILENHPSAEFTTALEALLTAARERYAQVAMMEIAAPPGGGTYLNVQREAARKHGATLIPKRRLFAVLTSAGNTVDGIHLSDRGQARLAGLVQSILGWENRTASGVHLRVEVGP